MSVRRRLAASLGALALVLAACSSDEPPPPTTTTGTALPQRTTVPRLAPSIPGATTTTTTIPAEVATDVDACELLEAEEVAGLAGEEPGPGRPVDVVEPGGNGTTSTTTTSVAPPPSTEVPESPTLLLSSCAWPTEGPAAVTLTYLAPTTARAAREHLQRLVDGDSRFARDARVIPLPSIGGTAPAALVRGDGIIEVAIINGSALLYMVPADPPTAGSRDAQNLIFTLATAVSRAPG